MDSLDIADLIDINAFQDLLESYSRQTGIAMAILDMTGAVLVRTGWKQICTEFHRKHSITAIRCLESDTVLAGKLSEGKQYNLYGCKNGLVDVAAPIYIENIHIGTLFIGQFLLEPHDIGFFTEQAEKYNFDKDTYLECLSKVPVLSIEQVNDAIIFLTNITNVMGSTGLDKKKLFDINRNLEQMVKERTSELTYSNERLQILTDASFEGIILSEEGLIIEVNNNILKLFGYDKVEEIIGLETLSFVVPEQRGDVEDKILTGYEKPYETLGIHKDGHVFPIEVCGRDFIYKMRRIRGAAIRDLTDRKKSEKEIQALRNILPICSFCKKIRDDKGYWEQVDIYFQNHSDLDFSHSVCPECMKEHYPKEYAKIDKE